MSNPILIKNFTAGAAISPYRVVKFSAAETVIQAAAAADLLVGICGEVGPASGERCDVTVYGIALAEAGAAITIGARLTSDATGRVITAAPAAGSNAGLIGMALDAALAAGDIIRVLVSQSSMQG